MSKRQPNPKHLLTANLFQAVIAGALLGAAAIPSAAIAQGGAAPRMNCTVEQGQRYIDQGRYDQAIREFTCIIESNPTEIEGYRGRIEAELLLGRYSDALADHAQVTANVLPVHPDAGKVMVDSYNARLATAPNDIPALVGASFTHWADYDYPHTIQVINHLLAVQPNSTFGNLFRGSSRLLKGLNQDKGVADIERAIVLTPKSADVRFIVADAYTYGLPDPTRAFAEASLALRWGLDTPRVHAILATSYFAFGAEEDAAVQLLKHFELITTNLAPAPALDPGTSVTVALAPGWAYEIPVPVAAGETLSIVTSSRDYWDSIAVLLAPDGTPVTGSDDANAYFAAFDWVAPATGTYRLRVTFFESVNYGNLVVTRD